MSNDVSKLSFVRDKTIANATSFGGNLIFLILLAVWFIGIFALGVSQLIKERAFLKKLDKLSELITDGTSIETKNRLIEEMGIKKDFRVFMNSIILSPFIIGFVKPRIFLSKNNFSDLETELILRHEMMHLKAKDYFYRRLMFILCVMYWFNLAVHIFLNKFIEINEMACDEATLKNYSNREKLVYAKLLRDMACSKPSIENMICLTGKTAINLQRRIINIMNSKKMMKKIPYIALSTLILGICPVISYAHQYWRSYFHFKGDYAVLPMYVPIYQDAVLGNTYIKTLKAQFIQLRRWSYGSSDVAYVGNIVFSRNRGAPFWPSFTRFIRLLEGHVTLASVSVMVAFGGWMPLLLNREAARSVVAHQLPDTVSFLQQIAMIGLVVSIFTSFRFLPPRPERYKRRRNILMLLQWVLMPVTSILYSSMSAYNAHTHLILGKYLDKFDVTEKTTIDMNDQKRQNKKKAPRIFKGR